jgi:hypothetical protein
MNLDATLIAPSPLWVRAFRSLFCFALAAVVAWRGYAYEDPYNPSVTPFIMCELMAAVLSMLGLLNLATNESEPGPA